jgi:hypothetical protein
MAGRPRDGATVRWDFWKGNTVLGIAKMQPIFVEEKHGFQGPSHPDRRYERAFQQPAVEARSRTDYSTRRGAAVRKTERFRGKLSSKLPGVLPVAPGEVRLFREKAALPAFFGVFLGFDLVHRHPIAFQHVDPAVRHAGRGQVVQLFAFLIRQVGKFLPQRTGFGALRAVFNRYRGLISFRSRPATTARRRPLCPHRPTDALHIHRLLCPRLDLRSPQQHVGVELVALTVIFGRQATFLEPQLGHLQL